MWKGTILEATSSRRKWGVRAVKAMKARGTKSASSLVVYNFVLVTIIPVARRRCAER